MHYRILATATTSLIIAMAGVLDPTTLHAQAPGGPEESRPVAIRLRALSVDRAARWAQSAPVITCGPAPLTERPGIAVELSRPHVAPLEDAFLDAAIVKRTVAARPGAAVRRASPASD
jgi:hypothetical protein